MGSKSESIPLKNMWKKKKTTEPTSKAPKEISNDPRKKKTVEFSDVTDAHSVRSRRSTQAPVDPSTGDVVDTRSSFDYVSYAPSSEDIAHNGTEYIEDVCRLTDTTFNQVWADTFPTTVFPTLFAKSMLFFEALSFRCAALVHEQLSSLKKCPEDIQGAIRKCSPGISAWAEEVNSSEAKDKGHKPMMDAYYDIVAYMTKIESLKPLPSTTGHGETVKELVERYSPGTREDSRKERKQLFADFQTLLEKFRDVFCESADGHGPMLLERQPRCWEKVATFARICQLALLDHESGMVIFRAKIEEGLVNFPSETRVDKKGKGKEKARNVSLNDVVNPEQESIKLRQLEMKELECRMDGLVFSWE